MVLPCKYEADIAVIKNEVQTMKEERKLNKTIVIGVIANFLVSLAMFALSLLKR